MNFELKLSSHIRILNSKLIHKWFFELMVLNVFLTVFLQVFFGLPSRPWPRVPALACVQFRFAFAMSDKLEELVKDYEKTCDWIRYGRGRSRRRNGEGWALACEGSYPSEEPCFRLQQQK